jgi:hypothetical protein
MDIVPICHAVLHEKIIPMSKPRSRSVDALWGFSKEALLIVLLQLKESAIAEDKVLAGDTIRILIQVQACIVKRGQVNGTHMTSSVNSFLIAFTNHHWGNGRVKIEGCSAGRGTTRPTSGNRGKWYIREVVKVPECYNDSMTGVDEEIFSLDVNHEVDCSTGYRPLKKG